MGVFLFGSGWLMSAPGSSPRSWGCFRQTLPLPPRHQVFPTLVGVFLMPVITGRISQRLPHARGGVSCRRCMRLFQCGSSPRSWGCFSGLTLVCQQAAVFPTLVGVFPYGAPLLPLVPSLPHARGGVSLSVLWVDSESASSPRSWGCFHKSYPR